MSDKKLLLASLQDLRADTKALREELTVEASGEWETLIDIAEEISAILVACFGDDPDHPDGGKAWNASDHPRDSRGRFAPKLNPDKTAAVSRTVGELLNRGPRGHSQEEVQGLARSLVELSLREIRLIRKVYGIGGGGRRKEELVNHLVSQLPRNEISLANSRRWNARD